MRIKVLFSTQHAKNNKEQSEQNLLELRGDPFS